MDKLGWIIGAIAAALGIFGTIIFGKQMKIGKLEKQNRELAHGKAQMEAERNRESQRADASDARSDLNASIAKVALKVGDDAEPAFGKGQALSEEDRKIAEDIMSNHR